MECDCNAASAEPGHHHWRFCLLWTPRPIDEHDSWCKCQRVCGGDQ